jgi:hypothetical protein
VLTHIGRDGNATTRTSYHAARARAISITGSARPKLAPAYLALPRAYYSAVPCRWDGSGAVAEGGAYGRSLLVLAVVAELALGAKLADPGDGSVARILRQRRVVCRKLRYRFLRAAQLQPGLGSVGEERISP